MSLLLISVAVVLVISAACSLTEAALYAVRRPYIRQLAESGSTAGKILEKFKQNMEQPITAILIVNTAANTAGAAVAGAQARQLFGESALVWFSAAFTIGVLFLSEIMPKIAGVAYSRVVAPLVSIPLNTVVSLLFPIVWFTQSISRLLQRGDGKIFAPEEEVQQMAALSAEEGSILPIEAEIVKHALRLDDILAKDIMTPRTVALTAREDETAQHFMDRIPEKLFSRIPVAAKDTPENWLGVVRSQDILTRLAKDEFDVRLGTMAQPIGFVPETTHGYRLLHELLTRRTHMLGVVDEYGSITGLVTLEDVLESVIGKEILDETDTVADLQQVARERARERFTDRQAGTGEKKPDNDGQ